ncbi:hypothetical protein U0E09_33010 [Bacillus thuringiensis]|uniref:Replication-associated protein ORF2/G2P domain-containing protein n=3 Tax=Bacillus TaxID=1386 RepID=A0AAN4HB64_BACTU|nr:MULTISPECIES: hypothetical protein [Bacillus]ERH96447.1 hypothetical protein BTCBT_007415 [Bacillus thuringiensis T01-328]MBN6708333.1 hypothetical protein [Bacillus thuringiensis]MDQ7259224.1 hypothetical protein [Bacillus thuringiensis]MDV6354393.1 hypothetical protein [Bacillus thuringiensis]MDY7954847.1 hypothetical protein [Bacillus thuringiensis]
MDGRDDIKLWPDATVKVTKMNHIVEVQHMKKMNRTCSIKKLNKDEYVDINTGEIGTFEHIENRQESYNSLRQTFKKLRYLINQNFTGKGNELHITLTYAENMTDTKQLYVDFDKFMKKLKYHFKHDTKYNLPKSSLDYLCVVEPQERGAWHCHLLLRINELNKNCYIDNQILATLWGQGFVKIKSMKDIDNIGAYLSAYLADVELTDNVSAKAFAEDGRVVKKVVDGEEKKFIKGGRLHMYPPGMNLYRKSKGILLPDRDEMLFRDIKKVVGSAQPHYWKSYHIENENFENTITFLQYNTKRKN